MNSYQKLKAKIEELEKQEQRLVDCINGDLSVLEELSIRTACNMRKQLERLVWSGETKKS